MNGWKRALIAMLEQGTEGRSYHGTHYPFCFNVKLYHVDASFADVVEVLKHPGDWSLTAAEQAVKYHAAGRLTWDAEQEWNWAVENACRSVTGDDWVKYIGDDVAKQYGLDPGDEYGVEVQLVGRSSGYIALTEFQGRKLNERSLYLAETLESHDGGHPHYTNKWCQQLLAYLAECKLMFNPTTASQECMQQLAAGMAKVKEGFEIIQRAQVYESLPPDKMPHYVALQRAVSMLTPESKLVFSEFAAALERAP